MLDRGGQLARFGGSNGKTAPGSDHRFGWFRKMCERCGWVASPRRAIKMVRPMLEEKGFDRVDDHFLRVESSGFTSVIHFARERQGFVVQYGTATPGLMAFQASVDGERRLESIDIASTLLFGQLFRPGYTPGSRSDLTPYWWRPEVVPDAELPSQLPAALERDVLRDLAQWSDRSGIVDGVSTERAGVFTNLPPARAFAMALYESGPSDRLARALERLEREDIVRRWVESQRN